MNLWIYLRILIFSANLINTENMFPVEKFLKKLIPIKSVESTANLTPVQTQLTYVPSSNQKYQVLKSHLNEQAIYSAPNPSVGQIWPKPLKRKYSTIVYPFLKIPKFLLNKEDCELIIKAIDRYRKRIFIDWNVLYVTPEYIKIHRILKCKDQTTTHYCYLKEININVNHCESNILPHENMDESYNIDVDENKVELSANKPWGILRALETFAQLIYSTHDSQSSKILIIEETKIFDRPLFKHRGLMIDTSRHFISIDKLLENLDAMEMNKMNVFHWHLTDDNSFPFVSKSHPELSEKGAFDKNSVYNSSVIKYIVEYARQRGIRVIPELDIPGHTFSIGLSHPEVLVQCLDGNFRGHLNPALEQTYTLIKELIDDIFALFPDKEIHLGFDEYSTGCMLKDPIVNLFRKRFNIKNGEYIILFFLEKIIEIVKLKDSSKSIIVWQDVYDQFYNNNFPLNITIQIWKTSFDDWKITFGKKMNKFIYSKEFYLDIIDYGTQWVKYYRSTINYVKSPNIQYFKGGEAAMWTEFVSNNDITQTIWPTTCALAEILWSSPKDIEGEHLGKRMEEQRCRMLKKGINVGVASGPGGCNTIILSNEAIKVAINESDLMITYRSDTQNEKWKVILIFSVGCLLGYVIHKLNLLKIHSFILTVVSFQVFAMIVF